MDCKFDNTNTISASNSVIFYDKTQISIGSVSPAESVYNVAMTVEVIGTGFFNSSELVCIASVGGKATTYPAVYLSPTSVNCSFPAFARSTSLSTALSFAKLNGKDDPLPRSKKFDMFDTVARIKTAKFGNEGVGFVVEFTKPSRPRIKSKDCANFFTVITKFGSKKQTKCIFRNKNGVNTLFVQLARDSTLLPADSLTFKSSNIMGIGQVTKYDIQTEVFTVASPTKMEPPKAKLLTSVTIGMYLYPRNLTKINKNKKIKKKIKINKNKKIKYKNK